MAWGSESSLGPGTHEDNPPGSQGTGPGPAAPGTGSSGLGAGGTVGGGGLGGLGGFEGGAYGGPGGFGGGGIGSGSPAQVSGGGNQQFGGFTGGFNLAGSGGSNQLAGGIGVGSPQGPGNTVPMNNMGMPTAPHPSYGMASPEYGRQLLDSAMTSVFSANPDLMGLVDVSKIVGRVPAYDDKLTSNDMRHYGASASSDLNAFGVQPSTSNFLQDAIAKSPYSSRTAQEPSWMTASDKLLGPEHLITSGGPVVASLVNLEARANRTPGASGPGATTQPEGFSGFPDTRLTEGITGASVPKNNLGQAAIEAGRFSPYNVGPGANTTTIGKYNGPVGLVQTVDKNNLGLAPKDQSAIEQVISVESVPGAVTRKQPLGLSQNAPDTATVSPAGVGAMGSDIVPSKILDRLEGGVPVSGDVPERPASEGSAYLATQPGLFPDAQSWRDYYGQVYPNQVQNYNRNKLAVHAPGPPMDITNRDTARPQSGWDRFQGAVHQLFHGPYDITAGRPYGEEHGQGYDNMLLRRAALHALQGQVPTPAPAKAADNSNEPPQWLIDAVGLKIARSLMEGM